MSGTSSLCLLKNFPPARHTAEVRHRLPGAGSKVNGSPHSPLPDPGISSGVPSIASHLVVPAGPGCCLQPHATATQAEMLRAIPAAWYTSATPCCCVPAPMPHPPAPPSTASTARQTAQALSHRDYPKVATAFSLSFSWSCLEKFGWEILLGQLSFPSQQMKKFKVLISLGKCYRKLTGGNKTDL